MPTTQTTALSPLETKLQNRTAKVAVIGLGYVGLPLCVGFGRVFKITTPPIIPRTATPIKIPIIRANPFSPINQLYNVD